MPRTGRDVVRGAAEGLRELGVDVLLAHAEVGELDVALPGQHHVVQLQVPVHWQHQICIIFWRVCYGGESLPIPFPCRKRNARLICAQ